MTRRPLALLLAASCLVFGACGDDDDTAADEAVEPNATATIVEDDEEDPGDDGDSTTTTSTVPDAAAEDPPADSGGEDEGMGDDAILAADLTGDAEVPGPGDSGAAGRIEIEFSDGRVCLDMEATGLDADVVAAHIHEGVAGTSGPPVVDIGTPTASEGDTDTWTDVCRDLDEGLRQRIADDPSQFYANVHTSTFPDGAVRGQLQVATIFDRSLS